jgi:D-serine deaminase-like pyridoxal phosphate-dependent protein
MTGGEMRAAGANAALIGAAAGREQLATPCLLLDLPAFQRNLEWMSRHCHAQGLALRPHAKTHKCIEIARRQIAQGARGICTVSVGEAEIFLRGGINDILITSPLTTVRKLRRFIAMQGQGATVAAVVDNLRHCRMLAAMAREANLRVPVYVDLDLGRHRTGVATAGDLAELGRFIASQGALNYAGLQAYAGHLSHVPSYAERRTGLEDVKRRIEAAVAVLDAAGLKTCVISGGSTGTCLIDAQAGPVNEAQFGSYIFMDVEYGAVDLDGAWSRPFEPALFVVCAVASANTPGLATADAGYKHFGLICDQPRIVSGPEGSGSARFTLNSDEHSRIEFDPAQCSIAAGDLLTCWIPHCDPTVNLYDQIHVFDGETLVDIWPVDARGAY